jgi:AbrB family looped-hinge helix DNA binding protein
MAVDKTYPKGQVIIPKEIREKLWIKPGKALSLELVDDHIEIKPLPDDPIEFLTGIFADQPGSMASDLLEERRKDSEREDGSAHDI